MEIIIQICFIPMSVVIRTTLRSTLNFAAAAEGWPTLKDLIKFKNVRDQTTNMTIKK